MQEKIKDKVIYLWLCALSVIFLVPYLGVIFYTLPRNDEFSGASLVKELGGYSLRGILGFVNYHYNNWEGNYSGQFLRALLNPISRGNADSTVYITNVLSFIFFIVAWYYIITNVLRVLQLERKQHIMLSYAVLIISINCRFMRETMGWFTGVVYYTASFMLGFVGFVIVMKQYNGMYAGIVRSRVMLFVACICAVVGVGGSLQISAALCWVALLVLMWAIYYKKDIIPAMVFFCTSFLFTIVNLMAPGYRNRKSNFVDISIMKGIKYTIICIYRELKRISTDTYIPYVLAVLFIVLFFILSVPVKRGIEYNPIVIILSGLICIFISTFPVCYGYSNDTISARGYEVMDLLFTIWMVLFMASIVIKLKSTYMVEMRRDSALLFVVLLFFIAVTQSISHISIADIPSVKCAKQLADGTVKDFSDYWRSTIHYVEQSQDLDVIIEVDEKYLDMESYILIDRCKFQSDPNNYVNVAAAKLYDHNSIAIKVIKSN